jgi:unsaturated rhamnogalacturonyl hydrolase
MHNRLATFTFLAVSPSLCLGAGTLTVKAVNTLQLSRPHETLEISAKTSAPLGGNDLAKVHVSDASGKELLSQAVDTDYDDLHTPDTLIFQADFAPGETKTFTLTTGAKHEYSAADFKAHGRFVRERFDDFAWENDRIAHRTYGKALETWKGEPLTSSTIDVWSKRTPNMVIDKWYMVDNYHADSGEGADFYSAGATRGCGGNGLWAANTLWVSRNFVDSRVLANGPIRVMFELVYDAFDVNGTKISEVKRITLDAGSHFDHFQSFYKSRSAAALTTGIGLKKVAGEATQLDAAHGWLATWEQMEKTAGHQGLALIVDPVLLEKQAEDQHNLLLLAKVPGNVASYWAGFGWDKAGPFTTFAAWQAHVDEFARRVRSPIAISVSATPTK